MVISKEHIRSRPKSYYEKIIKYCNYHLNPIEGHYFERSWAYIFNTHRDLSLSEEEEARKRAEEEARKRAEEEARKRAEEEEARKRAEEEEARKQAEEEARKRAEEEARKAS